MVLIPTADGLDHGRLVAIEESFAIDDAIGGLALEPLHGLEDVIEIRAVLQQLGRMLLDALLELDHELCEPRVLHLGGVLILKPPIHRKASDAAGARRFRREVLEFVDDGRGHLFVLDDVLTLLLLRLVPTRST